MNPETITFYFEKQEVSARPGDSIAKALFNAGIRTLSWSVKYKRARSIHCGRGRCISCHMEVDGVPGVPACITPVEPGMQVRREDFRPPYGQFLTWAARLVPLPAGFYYRMFTRPAVLRDMFLGSLRRMAGVGRVDTSIEAPAGAPAKPRVKRGHYDVIVVGAGLSGLAAAVAAGRSAGTVLLVDEYATFGGHALGLCGDDTGTKALNDLILAVRSSSTIEYAAQCTVQGFFQPNEILVGPGGGVTRADDRGMNRVKASTFIFATGAYDVVPLFDNSDMPGIFGTRAMRLFLERDNLRPGQQATVYGHGDTLVEAISLLRENGLNIVAVVDPSETKMEPLTGVRYYGHSRVTAAKGGDWLSRLNVRGRGVKDSVGCDLLCTAFNGQGAYELPYQAGFRFEMSDDAITENKVMRPVASELETDDGTVCYIVGELAGQYAWRPKMAAGERAGSRVLRSKNVP